MGKRGQSSGTRKGGRPLNVYADDDLDPDPESNDFYNDEVDDFHAGRNKVLLDEGEKPVEESEEEEEVLKVISDDDLLSSDEDDEEIRKYRNQLRRFRQHHVKETMDSDLEEEPADHDGLPDSKAWGNRRSRFYHADVIDDKFDLSGSEEESGTAAMEEKEALAIQKKMADQLEEQDFGLDMFTVTPIEKSESSEKVKVTKDLSKLSRREKLELLRKESPELITLIEDYISKLTEVKDIFQPLLDLVTAGQIQGSAAQYIRTRYHLNMNYCINVSFYLMLKSKHVAAHNHPVVKRMVQYRNLLKQLDPVDVQLRPEMDDILERVRRGDDLDLGLMTPGDEELISPNKKKLKKNGKEVGHKVAKNGKEVDHKVAKNGKEVDHKVAKRKKPSVAMETTAEKDALEFYQMLKKPRVVYADDGAEEEGADNSAREEELEEEEEEGKRAITYQIAKNKGMKSKRKKEQRNPRVKHRRKFERAKVRRKGQVREVRTETSRYGGELSGIRAGIKRGIKLK